MSVETVELRDAARDVLTGAGVAADEAKIWPQMLELGWLLVAVPEEQGGLGLGLPAACAIYAECGRALARGPLLASMLAADALSQSEIAEREAWIERVTTGERIAVALADGGVTRAPNGVSGVLSAVLSADQASHVLITADDFVALVPLNAAGVEVAPRPTWDGTRSLFDVRLRDVAIDNALVLARGPAANALRQRLATHRDFALASDAAGGAAVLLEMTVEYLKTRQQYGRPLALFQALKHRCADLKVQVAAAEALLADHLARLDHADAGEAEQLARAAKLFACAAYALMAEEAIQLHGGIGMTAEHPCHLFMKRAMLDLNLGADARGAELAAAARLLG